MQETHLQDQWLSVLERIRAAELRHGRVAGSVHLLAVSKTHPLSQIQALAQMGQVDFGENYIQEAMQKIRIEQPQGSHSKLCWHCIGPVQSNKSKWVANHFDWLHTLDRVKLATRLSEQREAHLPALNVLLQVKIDRGVNKSGIEPEEALPLAKEVLRLKGLRLRGIMTMPDPSPTVLEELAVHRLARTLFEQLQNDLGLSSQEGWDTLSMGMSQDMDSAIQAGSTMVRVGSAIFGARPKAQPA